MDEPGELDVVDSISDEELTALALAADPDAPLDADAVPFASLDTTFPELLPSWYMPAPMSFRPRRRRVVVGLIVGSLLVLNGLGLCVTYGYLEIA